MEQQKLVIMNYNFYISGSVSIVFQALLILALHCTLDYLNIRNFRENNQEKECLFFIKSFLCCLWSIVADRDHFVRHLSVRLSVRLSGSHTFLVVTHSYVRRRHMHSSECCHYVLAICMALNRDLSLHQIFDLCILSDFKEVTNSMKIKPLQKLPVVKLRAETRSFMFSYNPLFSIINSYGTNECKNEIWTKP